MSSHRFTPSELSVIDAKRDIMEKCHLPERLDDHGLYLAPTGGKKVTA
jgi:hypothetical protein